MPKCAFLSIANTEGWFIDDDLVHDPLIRLGWEVHNIPWNKAEDWNMYDVVVIRSPWDYQDHLSHFLQVLEEINQSKAILLNSQEIVKWNINKNYLFDLEKKGVELVPTIKTSSLNTLEIKSAFERFQTEELIVKPMIGANADDTFRIRANDSARHLTLESIFKNRECMLQPFLQNIVDEGEFSLMYFNGKLSHTILKTVATGDYRVQEEHGGGVIPIEHPESALVISAEKAMASLGEIPFYARVDLVRTPQNTFALMELELIEPCLYFRFGSQAAEDFAGCLDVFYKSQN